MVNRVNKKDVFLFFSGYYQPAGPLIQHPPTLPPVKGPPPDSTPTPPHNSEGSDDLVATSTTSGVPGSAGKWFLLFVLLHTYIH